jgi:hypothetical protein
MKHENNVCRSTVLLTCAAFLLCACAVVPVPKPQSDDSAVVGISLETRSLLVCPPLLPCEWLVYFTKVTGDSLLGNGPLLPATVSKGDNSYLLDAEPGRYVPVLAVREETRQGPGVGLGGGFSVSMRMTSATVVFFPKALLESSGVDAEPGRFAYAGTFKVDLDTSPSYGNPINNNPDEVQSYYYKQSQRDAKEGGLPFGKRSDWKGVLIKSKRDAASRTAFLAAAQEDLGADWSKQLSGK